LQHIDVQKVGWLGTVSLMLKTQIGLGILSIPAAFDVLGIVPGVICLCVIAGITTWSGYIIGVFKLRHPGVYAIDDAGGLMIGSVGKWLLGIAVCLCQFPPWQVDENIFADGMQYGYLSLVRRC
jgi:amino acid permease